MIELLTVTLTPGDVPAKIDYQISLVSSILMQYVYAAVDSM